VLTARSHETGQRDRLNVLLNDAGESWADQLPRLLEPQGVHTIRVGDVDEAVKIIQHRAIHALVVELKLPMERPELKLGGDASAESRGGLKLLRVIQRLDPCPPAVVIRGRRFDNRLDNRVLTEALKLEAFSVLDEPVELEQLLEVLRRLLERHYGGGWPGPSEHRVN
jgi:CheY-like chemotaxis protein